MTRTPIGNDPPIKFPCPYCDRAEWLDTYHAGMAWMVGHIHEEHALELPPFAGTGDDQ